MKYIEAIEYIESLSAYGIVHGLDSLIRLCERLENPQNDLSFVHIAGTNGNGSILAYVSTVLKYAGYKVGRYISYPIFEYRERFQMGNRPITKKAFCELVEQIKKICDSIVTEGYPHPTPFEVEMAMAFQYFKQQGCQVVTIVQQHEVMQVIEAQARVLNVPVTVADMSAVKKIKHGLEKQKFDYKELKNLEISLAGVGQIQDAVMAIEALKNLQEQGYTISETALRKGLKETEWQGSFSVIGKKPYFVVDDAHNEDTATELVKSIECYFTNKRIIFILGMLRDKECEKIISITHKYADWIVTVTPPNDNRAMSSYELAQEIAKVHPNVSAVDSPEEAVEVSYLLTGKEDVIIAFGSHSFLGRLMEIVENR